MSPLCLVCPVRALPELWAAVPGLPGVEASTAGRVRNATTRRLFTARTCSHGYLTVSITPSVARAAGTYRDQLVHRLVAATFLGPPPRDGRAWEVDHLDFDHANNAVTNLRWLPKDTNAWRWKFWTTEPPDEELARADRRWAEAAARGYSPDWTAEARNLITTRRTA